MPFSPGSSDTLYIRIGAQNILFARYDHVRATTLNYSLFPCKQGISANVNMHAALRQVPLTEGNFSRVCVSVSGEVTLVPLSVFDDEEAETIYFHNYPEGHLRRRVYFDVLPRLNAVMLFSVEKDLEHTLLETWPQAVFHSTQMPLVLHWAQYGLKAREQDGAAAVGHLFAYREQARITLGAFRRDNLDLLNSYEATHLQDTLYYILAFAHQWRVRSTTDRVWLCGARNLCEELQAGLADSLQHVELLKPEEEYSSRVAPLLKDVPYDMLALLFRAY